MSNTHTHRPSHDDPHAPAPNRRRHQSRLRLSLRDYRDQATGYAGTGTRIR